MEPKTLIVFICATIDFLIGLIVYSQNRKSETNIAYGVFALAVAMWGWGVAFFLWSTDLSLSIFFAKFLYFSGGLIATTFYYFALVFSQKKSIAIFKKILIILPTPIFVYLYFFSELMISNIDYDSDNNKGFIFGPLKYLFDLHLWSIFILAFIELVTKRWHAIDKDIATHILYVTLGTYLVLFVASLTNIISPIFHHFGYIWIGPTSTIIWVGVVSYAVVKHQLFNIKIIATELLVFGLWLFILIRTILADSAQDRLINAGLLFVTVVIGVFLIKSVIKEISTREEIERLAKDLTVANERLKELDKLKSEFVSIASHQLRSPLTAIKGYASLVLDGSYGKVPVTIREAVDKMYQASQSLVVMVEDFLNVSRIEQGRMKFDLSKTDLNDLVEKVIAEQSMSVERAGLKLSFSTDQQPSYIAVVDTGKIRQVITNLIDNAIKYTPKGSISVRLGKDLRRRKIIISVADTGMGIDKEIAPTLFGKFTRAKEANKVNVIGTGLGLYIVKEIVNGHHGRAWVESEGKGRGSTFFVELDEDYDSSHALKVADFAKTM